MYMFRQNVRGWPMDGVTSAAFDTALGSIMAGGFWQHACSIRARGTASFVGGRLTLRGSVL